MKSQDLIGLAAAGVGVYFLLKLRKATKDPTDPTNIVRTFSSNPIRNFSSKPEFTTDRSLFKKAGLLKKDFVAESKLDPGSVIMGTSDRENNITYKFREGDFDKLNLAQKILMNLPGIPLKWILG